MAETGPPPPRGPMYRDRLKLVRADAGWGVTNRTLASRASPMPSLVHGQRVERRAVREHRLGRPLGRTGGAHASVRR